MTPAGLLLLLALTVGLGLLAWGWRRLWQAAERANRTDWGSKWLNRIEGLFQILLVHYHRFEYQEIPLPKSGPALVVANHVSGLDPLLLIVASPRPVRFIIAQEQYYRFGLHWLFKAGGCIPVDRKSRGDEAFRAALDALNRGEVVALFPQGGIRDPGTPPPRLRRGVARLARLSGAPVYPCYISGINPRVHGHVLRSVFLRSRVRLETAPPVDCAEHKELDCLKKLAEILNKSET